MTLSITGGSCTFDHRDHSVTCHMPRVVLIKTPAACAKHHSTPLSVTGKECKLVKQWGERKQGFLKHPANKTFELGVEVSGQRG